MNGHEVPRRLVVKLLQDNVPEALGRNNNVGRDNWPPAPRSVTVADSMPIREEMYPAIIVQSTGSELVHSSQAGSGEHMFRYAMRVQVLVTSHKAQGAETASVGRDRLLLAVRDVLMSGSLGDPDYAIVSGSFTETTGIAVETLQSKPVAVGSIEFDVNAIEISTIPTLIRDTHTEIMPVDSTENIEEMQ